MNQRHFFRIFTLITILLLLATAGVSAQAPQPAVPQSPAANTNSRITFQGMLKENGLPVTGSRAMIFRLYTDNRCNTQVGSDISNPAVVVSQGLFSVPLDLDPALVNGQALWLEVTVGATALGCQEMTAAPSALSLRPGAQTSGAVTGGSAFSATNTAVTGASFGTYGQSDSISGNGVKGWATSTTGYTKGVYGQSDSTSGVGVWGFAKADSGQTIGNYGLNYSTSGIGVKGVTTASSGVTYGVRGEAVSPSGYGGYFNSTGTGLLAASTGSGVAAIFQSDSTPANPTVRLVENGDDAARIDFTNTTSQNTWTLSGNPGSANFNFSYSDGDRSLSVLSINSQGNLDIKGNITVSSQGLDYAEGFDVASEDKLPAGSILVIDPANPGKLMLSTSAYDGRVAGVIAGANGLKSGIRLGAGLFDYDVALSGRVYALVEASDAAIQPGDLLTTSALPGYAMKALDRGLSQGAILGKAMQPLAKSQKGLILVLVTLQ